MYSNIIDKNTLKSGNFKAVMQSDGNFVIYNLISGDASWGSDNIANLVKEKINALTNQGDQYFITAMYIGSNGKLNILCKNGDTYTVDVVKN